MANLRIVYNNAANRVSSIVASSTAGTLAASNLLTDIKTQVWRTNNVVVGPTLTLTWASPELIGVVALPYCNLTSAGQMRVQGYTNAGDASPVFDTGLQTAAPSSFGTEQWGHLPLGVNAYSYGGGTYACLWFAPVSVRKIVITFSDNLNPSGYIEAARVVCGAYWEPTLNCEYGAVAGAGDMSKHERDDGGNLRTDRGPRYKTLSFSLSLLPAADRNQVWRLIYGNGMANPVFVSLMPDDTDAAGEQIFQIYGKLAKGGAITYQFYNQFNSQIELEEF